MEVAMLTQWVRKKKEKRATFGGRLLRRKKKEKGEEGIWRRRKLGIKQYGNMKKKTKKQKKHSFSFCVNV